MNAPQYKPGEVLSGTVYRVVRHLATGGMGSVYDVEDTTVEKRYVLKTLHPQLVSREDLARRMRDEAKSLAKLQHPNIVDVITAGVTTDSLKMPFYVMERLIGQNLRVVLEKKSALDVTHAYRITIDVADALEHAHENALVHRDVKPENIFLHRNANGTTTTKLLDFGIVRLLDRKASHTHGKFIGTLRYASPEQITGREIGPATDIYSLGLVLYEMLAGRGPFDDAGDQYAIGAAHAGEPAPPLSRFVRVTPEVERLVSSMLSKEPSERPRDCFAVASELRKILREEEASPRSATAVNVLSAGTPPTNGLRQSGSGSGSGNGSVDTGPTMQGMIPPSGATPAAVVSHQPNTPVMPGAPGFFTPTPTLHANAGIVGSGSGASGAPISPVAPTLAASGLPEHYASNPPVQVKAPGYESSQPQAPPAHARVVDRNAPTRASAPFGGTQRLSANDTKMELQGSVPAAPPPHHVLSSQPPLANDDVVRDAFGAPAPLVVPPVGHTGSSPGDIVFPPMQPVTQTGPVSGEARTRPPERGPFILVLAAALAAIGIILLAIVLVRLQRPTSPSIPASQQPTATATATATAPSPTFSAAAPTTASPSASPSPPASPYAAAATSTAHGAASNTAPPSDTTSASNNNNNNNTTPTPTTPTPPASATVKKPVHHAPHPTTSPTGSGYAPPVKFE